MRFYFIYCSLIALIFCTHPSEVSQRIIQESPKEWLAINPIHNIATRTRDYLVTELFDTHPALTDFMYLKKPLLDFFKELSTGFTATIQPLLKEKTPSPATLKQLESYDGHIYACEVIINNAKEQLIHRYLCPQAITPLGLFTATDLQLPTEEYSSYTRLCRDYPTFAEIAFKPLPSQYRALNQKLAQFLANTFNQYKTEKVMQTISNRQIELGKHVRLQALAKTKNIEIKEPRTSNQLYFSPKKHWGETCKGNVYVILGRWAILGDPITADGVNTVAGCYKIHLMPKDEDVDEVLLRIFDAVEKNDDLRTNICSMKICYDALEILEQRHFPIIVIYVEIGKNAAQYVLNAMYNLFKDFAHKGAGWAPQYNYRVNDFLFFAQGDRDNKNNDSYQSLFEQPDMIYYRSDLGGTQHNFYLTNPATGKPATPPSK